MRLKFNCGLDEKEKVVTLYLGASVAKTGAVVLKAEDENGRLVNILRISPEGIRLISEPRKLTELGFPIVGNYIKIL